MSPDPELEARLQSFFDKRASFNAAVERLGETLRAEIRALGETLSVAQAGPKSAVTVREAMKLLGCGRGTVFALLKRGEVQRADGPGRATLITLASIHARLAAPPPEPLRHRVSAGKWKRMDARRLHT